MTSNILFLPFRKTQSVELANGIRQCISNKYDQHPDMFREDLALIDSLRRDATHVREPHVSGIRAITAYAAQLVWIGGKFPLDIGVEFTWYPALGYNIERPRSEDNLRYELSNILYNLAALYSQLAVSANRSTNEGLKSSANYFCIAAGVISHIKTNVLPELRTTPAEDMDVATLESIQQLMLAQAQECFWQKAVMDGYKDASIAKLAARVSDLYSAAGDWGIKSEAISSEWIHHTTAKHHHFAAAAQFRQACDCLEKRRYGEEIARLRDSMLCINEALKESRYINKLVLEDLTGLKNRAQEDLKRAEKDNDVIYLNPVPPKSELKVLDRANMAVAKTPQEVSNPTDFLGDTKSFGRPLFSQLVPFSVHLAASVYENRRDRLINTNVIDELEILTTRIHDTLRSLNLPGALQALEKPLGLPPTLVSHAEDVRQADALTRIERSFSETAKLRKTNEAVFHEGRETLQAEAIEDDRLRLKYGTERWVRPDSKRAATALWAQTSEIQGYLGSAANSDQLVQTKYNDCREMLELLSGTDRELSNFVPSSRRVSVPAKLEEQAGLLRGRLNDLSRLESRRRRKIESIRDKGKKDEINSSILVEAGRLERENSNLPLTPAHFEEFFERRLVKYDADIEDVKAEEREQEQLLGQLESTNRAFVMAKKGDTSSKEREQALQKLENAYYRYKEIVSNLDVGRKFYNDLNKIVGRYREDCRNATYARRTEATQLESDLNLPSVENLSLQQQKQDEPRIQGDHGTRSKGVPLPAPVATRVSLAPMGPTGPVNGMWTPDAGIKFGGSAGPAQPSNPSKPTPGQWDPSSGVRFG